MNSEKPTIKGIFVNSHIGAVRKQRGDEGVVELQRRYGKPLVFRNSENVPIAEEVKIIEHALDVLSASPIPAPDRAFEAGRLHFRNFTTTPLARIMFSLFLEDFKLMMLQVHNIAGHVFQGVKFSSQELEPHGIKVVMENNDYPLDHFRGLFFEWLHFAGSTGTVAGEETAPCRFEYTIRWK